MDLLTEFPGQHSLQQTGGLGCVRKDRAEQPVVRVIEFAGHKNTLSDKEAGEPVATGIVASPFKGIRHLFVEL